MEETEVEIPSLQNDAKLVVYSTITPNKDITVFVGRTISSSITDSTIAIDSVYLFDADVFLYNKNWDDSIQLQLTNDTISYYSCLQTDVELKKGETYTLSVSVVGYPSVSASTTIPENATVWDEDWDTSTVTDEIDGAYFKANVYTGTWKIPSENQYQFVSTNLFFDSSFLIYDYQVDYDTKDSIAIFESESFSCSWSNYSIYFSLVTADETFYKYIENYIFYNEITEDIHYNNNGIYMDLFRGIMPEYTNIDGGYGIFGSYLEDVSIFEIND
jgi:hypothetical protein